ncbi:hypothetical protein [Bacillus andreraoultii]|uniref:hypothetical protein n=1 Tax=Bacillus andreraoultii TaxID=1499685 RepID=UPI000AB03E0F|nr:hypothetical protein [Bacillus andreraoultii]
MIYYNPTVKLLLIPYTDEKVRVYYDGFASFQMPLIGKRPPFYTNPQYEAYEPVI